MAKEGTGKCLPFFGIACGDILSSGWLHGERCTCRKSFLELIFFFCAKDQGMGNGALILFHLRAFEPWPESLAYVGMAVKACISNGEWRERERQQKSNQTGRCCAARCWIAAAVVYEVTAQT